MSDAWLNFGLLLTIQLLLFIGFALYKRRLRDAWLVLGRGILIGIPFGLSFDLVLGKLLGLSTYTLGFEMSFLVPNAAFSYGIFAATVLLLAQKRPLHFWIATLLITTLYEVVNLFVQVWEWQFPVPAVLFPIVIAVGYMAGALLVVRADRLLRSGRF